MAKAEYRAIPVEVVKHTIMLEITIADAEQLRDDSVPHTVQSAVAEALGAAPSSEELNQ